MHGANEIELDVSQFKNGVYLISVEVGKAVYSLRFVKIYTY